MRSQRWRLRAAVTGAVVLALVATTGPTGQAAPRPASPGPAAPASDPLSVPASVPVATTQPASEQPLSATDTALPGSTKVTLITGDVVSYLPGTDGHDPQVQVSTDRAASFTQFRDGEHYYVYPSDARALVGAGKLDKALFDVTYLATNGYADDQATQLPVIVQYPKPAGTTRARTSSVDAKALSTKADALPATTAPKALPAARSALVQVAKTDATKFWGAVDTPAGVTGPAASTLDAGVSKIWLDHRNSALLDVSVPQIGAPQAWAAGYDGTGVKVAILDTGIDANHPDLTGKVIASKNFIDGESVQDGHGHGTHVASTIAGSGAASNGKYKGVAPGAQLIIGKVLDDTGHGPDTAIIAGMQWAAQQGADIVSISVGGTLSDGTDPMSETVDELSAQYGVLFVIAAGNTGPDGQMINAPGAADAALTVAAVDKQDQMAKFSSRGPRQGDFGLKPDIAAPGVDIVAARAEGTSMPGAVHVGDRYTTVSGTSMATPHVAGSAAILAQEHPEWTGQKIKQVLTSTAKDDGFTAYDQGSGRVDVARATTQHVYATSNVDFGVVAYPHDAPVSTPLTYANDADTPVTLDLTTSLTARSGDTVEDMLTVSPTTLTVPAHATAKATVTLDTTRGDPTWYSGAVHATGAGVVVNTAVGAYKQPKQVTVSISVIPPAGATKVVYGSFVVLRLDDQPYATYLAMSPVAQSYTGTLDAGFYNMGTDVTWVDQNGEHNRALVTNPTVDATGDVRLTFDLRKATLLSVRTPTPSVPLQVRLGYTHLSENDRKLWQFYQLPLGVTRIWSLPTGRATRGTFTPYAQSNNGVDPVTMSIRGHGRTPATSLHPQYQSLDATVARLAGRMSLPLVAAGHGLAADFDGLDATGRLVLLDLSDLCPSDDDLPVYAGTCTSNALDRVQNAQRAGAAGVLGYGAADRQFLLPLTRNGFTQRWPAYPIPTMSLTATEGRMLAARLARGPLTLDVEGTPNTPYLYALTFTGRGQMPSGRQVVDARNLYQVDNRLHADTPASQAQVTVTSALPGENLSGLRVQASAPGRFTTYYGPVGGEVGWTTSAAAVGASGSSLWSQSATQVFDRAGRTTRDWGEQPLVPNTNRAAPRSEDYAVQWCNSCRVGNLLSPVRVLSNDGRSNGLVVGDGTTAAGEQVIEEHLYRSDGTELPVTVGEWFYWFQSIRLPYFTLPAEPDRYRLTERFRNPLPDQRYGGTVDTERTFTSTASDESGAPPVAGTSGVRCMGWYVLVPQPDGALASAMAPCQPTGELYLGYDFDLDLDNTLPAGGRHTVTIAGVHSTPLTPEPKLTTLTLSLSFDDGAHWTRVRTTRNRDGSFTGSFVHPPLSRTTGAVSVRAEATDAAGSTVKQTITRAYGLRAPGHGRNGATAI